MRSSISCGTACLLLLFLLSFGVTAEQRCLPGFCSQDNSVLDPNVAAPSTWEIPLKAAISKLLELADQGVLLARLIPDLTATREGALTVRMDINGCREDCCSGDTPRLFVVPVVRSIGEATSRSEFAQLPMIGPTVIAIGPAVPDAIGRNQSDTQDTAPAKGAVDYHYIARGASTTYSLSFASLIDIRLWRTKHASEILQEYGSLDSNDKYVIEETAVPTATGYCGCIPTDASTEVIESAKVEAVNLPPVPAFETDIEVSLDDTTEIPHAFWGSDPENGPLWVYAEVYPLNTGTLSVTIDPRTGAATFTVSGLSESEFSNLAGTDETIIVYLYDLKPGEHVGGSKPSPDQYYNEVSTPVRLRFTAASNPKAVSVKEKVTLAEIRDSGCHITARFRVEDDDPYGGTSGRRLSIELGSGMVPPELHWEDWRVDDGLGLPYVCHEGFCEATATFSFFAGSTTCDRPDLVEPGTYEIEFNVFALSMEEDEARFIKRFAGSGTYTVTILNQPPQAISHHFENAKLSCGYASEIAATLDLTDADPDGDPVTVTLLQGPGSGELELSEDGSFVYLLGSAPPASVSFTYVVEDVWGAESEPATVDLTLHPIVLDNVQPTLGASSDGYELDDQGLLRATGVVELSDPDLSCSAEVVVLSYEASGMDVFRFDAASWIPWLPDQPIALVGRANQSVRFMCIPHSNAMTGEIAFRATDLSGETARKMLALTRNNAYPETLVQNCIAADPNDCWVVRGSSSVSGQCASVGPLRFTMEPDWYEAGCLQFRDLDGDPLTFRILQMPRFGTVNLATSGGGGSYFATVMYEIDRNKMLACHRTRTDLVDQLTVQALDPYGGMAEAKMNLSFEVLNTPPTCVNDSATTPAGVPVTIDVLANDSDPDEDVLAIVDVGVPAGGGASVVDQEIVYTPDPNVCGEDSFSYTVDDDYGGRDTAWVTVDVTDSVPPVAVCQSGAVSLGSDGTAVLDPTSLDGGSTDNCSIAGYDASEKMFDCSMLGDRPVMFTVFDGAGNSDSCWTTVSVLDEIAPVAAGQDIAVQLDEFGSVTVLATQIENGSTDNCGVTEILIDGATEETFGCANLGDNTVTFTVRDVSGNEGSAQLTITVQDSIAPIAQCQDLIASLDVNGEVTVAASSVDNGSTDNCGSASMSLDRDTFTEADIGEQTVALTVEDASGNSDACTAVITVQDDMAPDIDCPPDKLVMADTNRCYASDVELGTPTATDNTEVDWDTLTSNAPDEFPIGTTSVKWSVNDIYGNVGSCFQQVTVTEPVDPVVSCPGDMDVDTHDPDGAVVTFAATATDNCDASPDVSCSPASGSTFPIGDTIVTCTATDGSSNTDVCTFTVSVTFENNPPTASDDSVDMQEGGGCMTYAVLANDSDPDGDDLTTTHVSSPQCGTTAITGGGTTIEYCTEGCTDPPDQITFDYTITDGHDEYDTATVTVDMPDGPIINQPHN